MKDMFQELIKSQMQQQALQQAEEREARTQQMQMAQDELEKRRAQIGKVREAQQFLINRPQPMGLMNPLLEMADLATGGQTQYADQYRKSGRAQATPEERMKEALMTETGLANLEAQLPVPKFAAGSRAAGGVGMGELLALKRMEQQNKQWERSEARRWSGLEQQKNLFEQTQNVNYLKDNKTKILKLNKDYKEFKTTMSPLRRMFQGDKIHIQTLKRALGPIARILNAERGVLTNQDIDRALIDKVKYQWKTFATKLDGLILNSKTGEIDVNSLQTEWRDISNAIVDVSKEAEKLSENYKRSIKEGGQALGINPKVLDVLEKDASYVSKERSSDPFVQVTEGLRTIENDPDADKVFVKTKGGKKVTIRDALLRYSVQLRDPKKAERFIEKARTKLDEYKKRKGG